MESLCSVPYIRCDSQPFVDDPDHPRPALATKLKHVLSASGDFSPDPGRRTRDPALHWQNTLPHGVCIARLIVCNGRPQAVHATMRGAKTNGHFPNLLYGFMWALSSPWRFPSRARGCDGPATLPAPTCPQSECTQGLGMQQHRSMPNGSPAALSSGNDMPAPYESERRRDNAGLDAGARAFTQCPDMAYADIGAWPQQIPGLSLRSHSMKPRPYNKIARPKCPQRPMPNKYDSETLEGFQALR